jgi:MFS family permease
MGSSRWPVWKASQVTETIEQAVVDRAALQRRTLTSLRMAQVPGQAAVAGMVAVVTLLASDMLGSDRLAGIGSASFTLGAALTMVPLAAFMRRRGRRPGMTAALLIGAAGGAIAATGGQLRFFPLFVVGMILFGAGQASTLQGRYVAADLAEPEHQATAIAAIVWIGALGAVFGPLLTPFEKAAARSIGLDELIGPFVFASFLFLIAAAVVWTRLRPDPLAVSGGIDPSAERTRPIKQVRASIDVIAQSSGARLGFAAMAISQAVMVGVMTMTPPHMKDHDHANLSAFVIAVHILGMYGLAPFVGRAVEHIGRVRSIQIGAVVLGSGTMATVLAGYVPALMFVGLFFLGLGWNIGLIAGSTLLTASVPAKSKVEVQGTSDLTMSFCGALAAFSSGFIKQSFGFHLLANIAAVLAGGLLVYAWMTAGRDRAALLAK